MTSFLKRLFLFSISCYVYLFVIPSSIYLSGNLGKPLLDTPPSFGGNRLGGGRGLWSSRNTIKETRWDLDCMPVPYRPAYAGEGGVPVKGVGPSQGGRAQHDFSLAWLETA
jgi:hypothetical protein